VKRLNILSGGPWEALVGYSRAVRVDNHVAVAGTTAAEPDGTVFGGDDGYLQARRCFDVIAAALADAGASLQDVVRVRMFLTDITRWEEFARAHAEYLGDVRPASTMVEVARLMTPEMLVEIEVDAIVAE
jgi:enamine deaminase RidA (YjgF/YER057c/UK114 family)